MEKASNAGLLCSGSRPGRHQRGVQGARPQPVPRGLEPRCRGAVGSNPRGALQRCAACGPGGALPRSSGRGKAEPLAALARGTGRLPKTPLRSLQQAVSCKNLELVVQRRYLVLDQVRPCTKNDIFPASFPPSSGLGKAQDVARRDLELSLSPKACRKKKRKFLQCLSWSKRHPL